MRNTSFVSLSAALARSVCECGRARFNANDLIMGFVRRPYVGDFTAAQLEKCKKSERDAAPRSKSESGPLAFTYTRAHAEAERKIMSTEKISRARERETLKGSRRFSRRAPNCVSES